MKRNTLKKAVAFVLAMTLVTGGIPVNVPGFLTGGTGIVARATVVDSGTCGDNVTWSLNESGTLTVSGTGAMADYTNDESQPWYSSRNSITNVVIESGVTSIGQHTFGSCSQLTNVDIPSSVTSIGNYAFYPLCSQLTSVTIPNGVTSIGIEAFAGSALTSVTIPSSVTSIDAAAFMMCQALANVTFTPGTSGAELTIGNNAFKSTPDNATVSFGTGNTKLYDGDTDITSTTKLTDIQNKTLTWKSDHTHSLTYSAVGATITATCDADGCTLPEVNSKHTATLTIAPSSTDGYGASLSGDTEAFGVTDSNIEYSSDGTNWSTTVPTESGSYQARIVVADIADSTKTYTATVSYGVNTVTTDKTYTTESNHGTVSVPAVAVANTTVTINATPETGFELESLMVTKASGGTVDVMIDGNNGTFTMPAEAVTVSATFAGCSVSASLDVTGNDGTNCKAVILDENYNEINSVTKKAGEKFILLVNREDEYDFNVTGADTTEFTNEDYQAYYEYATNHNIYVSSDAVMLWVTMPATSGDNATVTATFQKQQTYTILYQPQAGKTPDVVVCKIERTVNNAEEVSYMFMQRGATMGDGTAVWSTKMTAAFAPSKLAFISADMPSTDNEKDALASTLENTTPNNATVSQNASWTNISGDKYLIIGGEAKVVTAAFITDASKMTIYKDNTVDAPEITDGATYQLAVCQTDGNGNVTTVGTVTAPATPTSAPEGKEFVGWRGFQYDANGKASEKIYAANEGNIPVRDNATFTAVWKPVTLKVNLNLNGGTGGGNVSSVTYGNKLTISENPTREGYSFGGWTVSKTVTENGVSFAQGSPFDLNTPVTADLELTAQWKHVHSYSCYQISGFGDKLAKYQKYESALHIAVCSCDDVKLMAHEFDSNGKCACGYQIPTSDDATLEVSYGQMSGGTYTEKMAGLPETAKKNQEVSICAPTTWGNLVFSKWVYSTNGTNWYDLTADAYASFLIPCDMQVRALYVNPVTKPQVDLSARLYDDQAEVDGQTYTMDNTLFHLNYKLPDGYTLEDAGIRLGDNNGISYYFIQQIKYSYDNECKGIIAGLSVGMSALGCVANKYTNTTVDTISFLKVGVEVAFGEGYDVKYLETEDNVLDKELDAATLAQYMYEGKPVNVEKYPPIYWEAKARTKGLSGSMDTIPPLRFAQKYGGRNYIYGIGYLRYKDKDGISHTIYTEALPASVNNMPNYTVKADTNGKTNTKLN